MADNITVDKELDIKAEVCPYTFVKTKLALEAMASGQVLKIIIDHQPASENVPRSLKGEGHEVLEVKKVNDTDWWILVRKG